MDYLGRVLRGWANYFRHAVAKRAFNAIDSYTWERITSWLRKKNRIGWPELRRRFCLLGTWRLAHDGQRFRGAASVTVIRYRYRGYRIPTPVDPHNRHHLTNNLTRRARCGENRTPGSAGGLWKPTEG